ncbi:hypothetical protein K402DRAFT_333203 [Aulographum hederae CBS 113979]|uniref:Small ribosomal subunit protein mS35 mitochondrial conserved domain-containing protein n=1 Tax=Aulographum hederae CBS 113979 TaxID=1176131 RepID=A0A6G1GZ44_9PEZI|nr:hypothetical protein K402DRAFT_333203 [Aulographum hederae CBS 113979]
MVERDAERAFNTGVEEENHTSIDVADITSLGHFELEQQREIREFTRLAAWELPLLSRYAQPFQLPTKKTPFRFRYTSYLNEDHPSAPKVVVEFSPSDLPDLTTPQQHKLIKLAATRYNPSTDTIKMNCESHRTRVENKAHLLDQIKALLNEAKDPADTFEDVPFDFRHHKPKRDLKFPKEWRITPERQAELDRKRALVAEREAKAEAEGKLLAGESQIRLVLGAPNIEGFQGEKEPVLVGLSGRKRRIRG